MRILAFVLLAAVFAAAAVFYGMVMTEGEGGGAKTSVVASKPAASAGYDRVADWVANIDRHEPPLAAPSTPFTTMDGKALTLADFEGSGVVLNLWATWCGPCVREMPSLDRLQQQVEADGIKVVAVSSDQGGRDVVQTFMTKHGLDTLQPYLDPGAKLTLSLAGQGLPRTYILNSAGEIAASYVGPAEWDAPELVAVVRDLAR